MRFGQSCQTPRPAAPRGLTRRLHACEGPSSLPLSQQLQRRVSSSTAASTSSHTKDLQYVQRLLCSSFLPLSFLRMSHFRALSLPLQQPN
jgi:hypothetical protein